MSDVAVIVMAYGSPDRLEDVPAYYADIRGGRPVRPELLDDLVERYRRLGIEDGSPLNAVTEETRAALEREAELVYAVRPDGGEGRLPFSYDFSFNAYPLSYERMGPEVKIYRLSGGKC